MVDEPPKKPFQKHTQKAPSPILFVPLPNNTNQIEKPDSSVSQEKWRENKKEDLDFTSKLAVHLINLLPFM